MKDILILMSVIGLFSCGPTKTRKSGALMDQKIIDSLEIVIQIENCVSLKGENNLTFYLKNNSHSSLAINTSAIIPSLISDSAGNNIPGINLVDYTSKLRGFITLEAGVKKEVSYETSYFSNYDLKKGQPYYVHGFYITSGNTKGESMWPSTKFYICDQ
jgi:hypothetical protein